MQKKKSFSLTGLAAPLNENLNHVLSSCTTVTGTHRHTAPSPSPLEAVLLLMTACPHPPFGIVIQKRTRMTTKLKYYVGIQWMRFSSLQGSDRFFSSTFLAFLPLPVFPFLGQPKEWSGQRTTLRARAKEISTPLPFSPFANQVRPNDSSAIWWINQLPWAVKTRALRNNK